MSCSHADFDACRAISAPCSQEIFSQSATSLVVTTLIYAFALLHTLKACKQSLSHLAVWGKLYAGYASPCFREQDHLLSTCILEGCPEHGYV